MERGRTAGARTRRGCRRAAGQGSRRRRRGQRGRSGEVTEVEVFLWQQFGRISSWRRHAVLVSMLEAEEIDRAHCFGAVERPGCLAWGVEAFRGAIEMQREKNGF